MTGFLTGVFDGGGDGQSTDAAQHVGLEDELAIDQSFTVSAGQSFGFEDMNGGTHEFSNEQSVTVDISTHAVLGVAADVSQGAFTGDGFEE